MRVAVIGGSGYLANILNLNKSKKINFVFFSRKSKNKINIINYNSFKDLELKLKNFDCIIHLAGADKNTSENKKKNSLNFKKKITEKICKIIKKYKIKLIYISSIQIYKNFSEQNYLLTKSSINKKDIYSRAHFLAEQSIKKSLASISKQFLIIRLSNVYGYRKEMKLFNPKQNLFNNFCYQALKKKIIVLENPSNTRNFIPLNIFNNLIVHILNENKFSNNIINFGYKTYDLKEISNLIANSCKKIFNLNVHVQFDKYIKKKNL